MEDGTITLVGATTENPSFRTQRAAAVAGARPGVQVARRRGDREAARARRSRSKHRALPLDDASAQPADRHGRRRRPCRADACRGSLARGAQRRDLRPPRSCRRSCSAARRSTTRRRTGTTTSSARCTNRCAAPIRTPRSIISLACSMPASRRSIIARRVVRMAIEDIGLADPQALVIANAAKDAYDFLGSARGRTGASLKPCSMSPPRRNRTPSTRPTAPPCARRRRRARCCRPSTSSTRRPT